MSGWTDWIFGNLPPMPAHPSSRGALLGARYQAMPDMNASITDTRQEPFDNAYWMQRAPSTADSQYLGTQKVYRPSMQANSHNPSESDPMLLAANSPGLGGGAAPSDVAPYNLSFNSNFQPRATGQAPYNSFGGMGPNRPAGPLGTSADPAMPYMGAHLPISPGDPGWTPPPSPSGPHNPGGDPARPGYDSPSMQMGAFSPQQIMNALQYWGGGQ